MPARRDLGHDAPVPRVQIRLRGDDRGEDHAVARDDGGRGLVAGGLDPEDVHPPSLAAARLLRLAPHDQRVLAVVGVVAAADALRLEAEPLVQADRADVRDADLEGVAAVGVVLRQVEEPPRGARMRYPAGASPAQRRRSSRATRRRTARGRGSRPDAPVSSTAPNESELGFASSEANIDRDQGVGYDARSITSIASRSSRTRRRSSRLIAPTARRRALARRSARSRRRGRTTVASRAWSRACGT